MSKVTCIDISCWQTGVDFNKVKNDGIEAVIIRAGFGREASQKDNEFETHYKNAKAAGLKIGAYWYSYANGVPNAKKEAEACLSCIKGKRFDLPVYYDLEDESQVGLGKSTLTEMAKVFCEAIKAGGYRAGVYANLNWFNNYLDYDELKKSYSIWLAQYYTSNSKDCDVWQNSSTGKVDGVEGNVDTNVIFNRNIIANTTSQTTSKPSSPKKSNEAIALEVIAGKWGNGDARKNALTKAGYDYNKIQAIVNTKMATKSNEEIAKEVIAGKWGNGDARKNALTKAGYDYNKIQAIVNTKMATKSNEEIAKEVIAGKWGNGDARKNALTKAGYDYNKIQSIVNAKLGANKKSIDTVAREVIAGKWGNGIARKNALIKAGYDYNEVQKRVNELL